MLRIAPDGKPYRPCFFSIIDSDRDSYLTIEELNRHFSRIGQQLPPHVMNEDKDSDGKISWGEFTGPKEPLIENYPHLFVDQQQQQQPTPQLKEPSQPAQQAEQTVRVGVAPSGQSSSS